MTVHYIHSSAPPKPLRALLAKIRNFFRLRTRFRTFKKFAGRYTFENRSSGHDQVIIILAGYKKFLWTETLDRIANAVPTKADVCVVSSGTYSAELSEFAQKRGFSYLATRRNNVGLSQNIAIKLHPRANWIAKIDEDMFVEPNFFSELRSGFEHVQKEKKFDPGFCIPIINLNGCTSSIFLVEIGKDKKFIEKFGSLPSGYLPPLLQRNIEAAKWIWEQTLQFPKIVKEFRARPFKYSAAPHPVNIGACGYPRSLWEAMEYFPVSWRSNGVGLDESWICEFSFSHTKPIIVLHNVFAGHFSFGPQEHEMRSYLPKISAALKQHKIHKSSKLKAA
jgi:hypothetical protein